MKAEVLTGVLRMDRTFVKEANFLCFRIYLPSFRIAAGICSSWPELNAHLPSLNYPTIEGRVLLLILVRTGDSAAYHVHELKEIVFIGAFRPCGADPCLAIRASRPYFFIDLLGKFLIKRAVIALVKNDFR